MDLSKILHRRYKGQGWSLNGDTYEGLIWNSDTQKPSKKELESQWESVLAEIEEEQSAKTKRKQKLLDRLGITEEEVKLLLS